MLKRYLTLGSVCGLFAASTALAQETIALDNWAFTSNYASVGTATGVDTAAPTFTDAEGANMAFGVKFSPRRISEVEDFVTATMTLTVDGGFTGGLFRVGIFSDNGKLTDASGDPAMFGGDPSGFTGYLWALSAGSDAPGSADADDGSAGTGTITAKTGEGNWLSTYSGYSVVKDPYFGPAEGSPDSGTFDVKIDLYRTSATSIEMELTIKDQNSAWSWSDQFREDNEAVAASLTAVNFIGFADLGSGSGTWQIANAEIEGFEGDPIVGGTTWLGFDVGADGWASTDGWLGWVHVDNAPWVFSYSLNHYIYVPETSYTAGAGGWTYIPAPAAQ